MGEEGLPVLIETLDMFDWFMNDGFPEAVILDHNMTVFDLPSDYEPNYLNNQIQAAVDNCDVCGVGGLAGDINNDGNIDVLDVVMLVNYILSGDTSELDGADINNDGEVNILDVVALIEIILNHTKRIRPYPLQ